MRVELTINTAVTISTLRLQIDKQSINLYSKVRGMSKTVLKHIGNGSAKTMEKIFWHTMIIKFYFLVLVVIVHKRSFPFL